MMILSGFNQEIDQKARSRLLLLPIHVTDSFKRQSGFSEES